MPIVLLTTLLVIAVICYKYARMALYSKNKRKQFLKEFGVNDKETMSNNNPVFTVSPSGLGIN